MNLQCPAHPTSSSRSSRYLPLLFVLFAGSGCAALIYEIVWFELLELVIGSSAVSIGILLAVFMGGMCIGSIYLARFVPISRHPLRVYALLEISTGLLGLVILFGLLHVSGLYAFLSVRGMAGVMVRALLSAVCLLPPTVMMGATLPAIARLVEATPKGMSWMGLFYGGNTAGAVCGSLLAGFYLLRVYDVSVATYAAAAVNLLVGAAALGLARLMRYEASAGGPAPQAGGVASRSLTVLLAIALSGMTALAAEVVWTRLLSLMMGATVYTFSLILAAFLLGLGVGSGAGSLAARSISNVREAFGWCQFLLLGGIAWAWFSITQTLPYRPIDPELAEGARFLTHFLRCLWAVLPAACLWGASFPMALAAAAGGHEDSGRLVGEVYAANTVGAIAGALGASMLMIGWLGTRGTERLMILLAASGAALILAAPASGTTGGPKLSLRRWKGAIPVVFAILMAWMVPPVPDMLIAYGRDVLEFAGVAGEFVYVGEGMNSSMAVSRLSNGTLLYHNAGKVQASSERQDMALQRMLGHMTTLVAKDPRSVLVIGCGAGVTAGAVSIDPRVERVTIAEIERLVPKVVSTYFSEYNFDVIHNPKVRIEIDDARHYVITSKEKFDAITSDPFDPWVKGAATLYTKEFFELLKQHLNPGGVLTVFVQLYQSDVAAVKSEFATFFDVFPNGTVWFNLADGEGYDLVLMGQVEPSGINLDAIDDLLSRRGFAPVAESLNEINFYSASDLFSTYGGSGEDLKPWLHDAQINRDRNLRLQYLAGLSLDFYRQDAIYREIVKFRRFPDKLFAGSPEHVRALKKRIESNSE